MAVVFLALIYMAFIGLGLPDSLLGTAWPLMQPQLGLAFDSAGLISMSMTGSTVISSLASARIINRFGTGPVTFVSTALAAAALIGFAFAPGLVWLVLLSIPLGLGGGCVDAGLNGYMALHYKARHMSWLHCFWGIGATLGPVIMAFCIRQSDSWRAGYIWVGAILSVLAAILFLSLPLWDKPKAVARHERAVGEKAYKLKGVKQAMAVFMFYCAIETTIGLWGSSYLVNIRNAPAPTAAFVVSTFYGGITAGRFICGFLTMRFNDRDMIRGGIAIMFAGAILIVLPGVAWVLPLLLIGLGCAPIYPSMTHKTPLSFGREHTQSVIGYQMASTYIGISVLPPLFGVVAAHGWLVMFPAALAGFIIVVLFASEWLNRIDKRRTEVFAQ